MALRNPNLILLKVHFPKNVYKIMNRFIEPQNSTVNVVVTLRVYTDETLECFPKEYQFTIVGLPNTPSVLSPELYQQKLLEQHGDTMLDGTKLSDFIVLPD